MKDATVTHCNALFERKFGVEIQRRYDFVAKCDCTTRKDGKPFTAEQSAWLAGFDAGVLCA